MSIHAATASARPRARGALRRPVAGLVGTFTLVFAAFGPALAEGRLADLWIYIVGPMLGAVLAALLYEWLRARERGHEETL